MATVPTEITWVSGQVVTAAQLNTNLRDAVNFLINPPTCQCRQTVGQSIGSGATGVVLTLDTEDVDNDNMHSTVTNTSRFTAVTAGRYQCAGGYTIATAGGRKEVFYSVSGTVIAGTESGIVGSGSLQYGPAARGVSVFLNVGSYLELGVFQDSGGASTTIVSPTSQQPMLFARWIGTT